MEYTADQILAEVTASRETNTAYWTQIDSTMERYLGPSYQGAFWSGKQRLVLNTHEADFVSAFLPRTVWDVPRVIGSADTSAADDAARILAHTVSDLGERTAIMDEMEFCALDYAMGYCVGIVQMVPAMGYEGYKDHPDGVPMWPTFQRISPSRFGCDWTNPPFGRNCFAYHVTVIKRAKLLARAAREPGWNGQVIHDLPRASKTSFLNRTSNQPDRDEVAIVEFWARDVQIDPERGPEDGFHGTWYTISESGPVEHASKSSGIVVRKPRPAYCPPWGPYIFRGAYPVRDEILPLSPLHTTTALAKDVEEQMQAASRSAKMYKRIVLVDATRQDLIAKLQTPDSYIVPCNNLVGTGTAAGSAGFVVVEIGGVTDQQLKQIEYAITMLDRSLGFGSSQRGRASGATATAEAIADQAFESRAGWHTRKFSGFVLQALRSYAWYVYHDEDFMLKIAPPELKQAGYRAVTVRGGLEPGETPLWHLMSFSIDQASTAFQSLETQTARGEAWASMFTAVLPLVRQYPEADWTRFLAIMGELYLKPNTPDLVNVELSHALAKVQGVFEPPPPEGQGTEFAGQQPGQQRPRASVFGPRKVEIRTGGGGQGRKPMGQSGGGMGPGVAVQGQAGMGAGPR